MVPNIRQVVVVLEEECESGDDRILALNPGGTNIDAGGRLGGEGLVAAVVLAHVRFNQLRQIRGAEGMISAPGLAPTLTIGEALAEIRPIHGNPEPNLFHVIKAISL